MRCLFAISIFSLLFLSACRTAPAVSSYPAIQVEPPRNGQILVIVQGGPVMSQGKHWFPDGVSLATVLDWAGLVSYALPHKVFIVDPDGHAVRCRVDGRPREELKQIKVSHGTRIIVPWDRCFGMLPTDEQIAVHRRIFSSYV
jgi:hypothetical protein